MARRRVDGCCEPAANMVFATMFELILGGRHDRNAATARQHSAAHARLYTCRAAYNKTIDNHLFTGPGPPSDVLVTGLGLPQKEKLRQNHQHK